MIGSSHLRPTGVVCALALLAAGCAARGTARFPGSPLPQTATAPAPSGPASQPVLQGDPVTEPTPLSAHGPGAGQGDGSAAADAAVPASIFEIQGPALDPERAVTMDLWPIVPDIDIPLNARILRFVKLFTGGRRAFLE